MHLFLIAALGPWGHQHSAAVLIWNVFFIIQNWLLFPSGLRLDEPIRALWQSRHDLENATSPPETELSIPDSEESSRFRRLAVIGWIFLAMPLMAPLGEPLGYWDHWLSWAVYAARPERVTVLIHEQDAAKLPPELQPFLEPPAPLDAWRRFRIDRWSLAATRTPVYPEARYQIAVARALAARSGLSSVKLVIESAPNRWTGQRTSTEVILADTSIASQDGLGAGTAACSAVMREMIPVVERPSRNGRIFTLPPSCSTRSASPSISRV
jgi:hypothetical protein